MCPVSAARCGLGGAGVLGVCAGAAAAGRPRGVGWGVAAPVGGGGVLPAVGAGGGPGAGGVLAGRGAVKFSPFGARARSPGGVCPLVGARAGGPGGPGRSFVGVCCACVCPFVLGCLCGPRSCAPVVVPGQLCGLAPPPPPRVGLCRRRLLPRSGRGKSACGPPGGRLRWGLPGVEKSGPGHSVGRSLVNWAGGLRPPVPLLGGVS